MLAVCVYSGGVVEVYTTDTGDSYVGHESSVSVVSLLYWLCQSQITCVSGIILMLAVSAQITCVSGVIVMLAVSVMNHLCQWCHSYAGCVSTNHLCQ